MKKLFLFFVLISSSFILSAQSVSVNHFNINQGTQVLVPINLADLTNVGALTLFLSYDNTVLEYDTVLNINSQFPGLLYNNMGNQQIGIVWSAFSSGVTISSGQLCQVRFNFLGGSSDLDFTQGCDIANFNAMTIPVSYVDGSVSEIIIASISSLDPAYCQDGPAINLIGTPTGGTFAINGNTATVFQPNLLIPGTYTVDYIVTNPYGFGDTASQQVLVHGLPSLSIQAQDVCYGQSTGTATAIVTGGASPYSYSWSNGQTTASASNLTVGSYNLSVTDENGCGNNATFNINQGTEIIVGATIAHLSVLGAGDGAIDITVTGGNPPYSYNWTGSITSEDLSNLDHGLYNLSISDASSCEQEAEVLVRIHSSQQMSFSGQWNLFSFNIEHYEPLVDSVFQSIITHVLIAKDGAGNAFWPLFNVNQIGNFEIGEGYQIKCDVPVTFTSHGFYLFPEEENINLPTGWTLMGYLRTSNMALETAVNNVVSNITIMKNGTGQVFWPQFNVNSIINMIPGQGYQIKMSAADTLVYPGN